MAIPASTADTHPQGIPVGSQPPPDAESVQLLELLVWGLTDEAIARERGISVRTGQRRISPMQSRLGVDTRFQLRVQASRHGRL